ncbi:MAG: hypothetical protein IKE60_26440 [Reyranella sp.]|uniref:hypothetical protein n=1 Tax=Reyranella sp. TaxID=1929291 RepID=UPI0025FD989B|nr:hypothetical protein [Reyranella sp.]MBR2818229.1 hypothetical protein [Reyranella sp.]
MIILVLGWILIGATMGWQTMLGAIAGYALYLVLWEFPRRLDDIEYQRRLEIYEKQQARDR